MLWNGVRQKAGFTKIQPDRFSFVLSRFIEPRRVLPFCTISQLLHSAIRDYAWRFRARKQRRGIDIKSNKRSNMNSWQPVSNNVSMTAIRAKKPTRNKPSSFFNRRLIV